MDTDEALEIVMDLAYASMVDDVDYPEEFKRQSEALYIVGLAQPFLATALKLAWQGAEPKPPRVRRRALELGG